MTQHKQDVAWPMAQVFLAYAPEDRALPRVEAIGQLLVGAKITLWCQSHESLLATAAETQISRAVEACDNYVILLSARALQNVFCLQGLLFALSMNKRVVPVLLETMAKEHLPEPLQRLAWVDMCPASLPLSQSQGGQDLLRILHHQAAYHYTHKRLLTTALDWERQGRNPDYLLGREELSRYQDWLQGALQRSRYRPIQLQVLFVATSYIHLTQQTRTSLPLWLQQANALAKTRIW